MAWAAKPTGKRGRQPDYSDAAIQTCLTLKVLFGMALRQTTGFVESLLRLVGLDWEVPNFSTRSRRQKTLRVNIPYRGSQGPLHPLGHCCAIPCRAMDSTGIKVEGEGEWHARKHGGPKRRVWRKIHLGIDEETLEMRAVEVTSSEVGHAPMLPELLAQIPTDQDISSVTADGAFDTANAMTPSPPVALLRSCRRAGTPNRGSATPPGRSRAARRFASRNASAGRSGDDGAVITAGAASRQRCTVSNCWANAWPRGTSTVRWRGSKSA
jgi:hypothetical protein